jgi:hypothetical protein
MMATIEYAADCPSESARTMTTSKMSLLRLAFSDHSVRMFVTLPSIRFAEVERL